MNEQESTIQEQDPRDAYREHLSGDHWELPSQIAVLDAAQREMEERLRSEGWGEEELNSFTLAFREALINAVTHGSMGVEGQETTSARREAYAQAESHDAVPPVIVDSAVSASEVTVTIKDSGKGFDWKSVVDPTSEDRLWNQGGRGLLLMRSLTDAVTFNEAGNEVTLRKKRTSHAQ